jgi:citrate lyase subunit beta/citryl-CoA lyase
MVSLIVPGSSERMLAKARDLSVREVVIDLEDAVVADRKSEALALAIGALSSGFAAARVSVRINPPGSPWAHQELIELTSAPVRPTSVVVPKVSDSGDLAFVERLLAGAEAAADVVVPMRVQALIETATGIANLQEIAGGSPRLEALVLGYADLAVSLSRSAAYAADLDSWAAVQSSIVVAARSAGVLAIDGPFLTLGDPDGLNTWAGRIVGLGFDGKWAIHPGQIDRIHSAFTPSDASVNKARAIIDALAEAERLGLGAVRLDGQMLDEAVRLAALRTLERAGLAVTEPSQ